MVAGKTQDANFKKSNSIHNAFKPGKTGTSLKK